MESIKRTKIFRQPIQVASGWGVRNNKFCDVDPERIDEIEGYTFDEKWLYLENELLVCEYEKNGTKWTLDMGWFPEYEPNGQFVLGLLKNLDWDNQEFPCETRSIAEIVQSVNETMLRLSRENGDFTIGFGDVHLQSLRPNDGCRFVKNEFFELDPDISLTEKQWRFFHGQLLRIESWSSGTSRIEMGWFPAYDPNGSYIAKLINENLENPLLDEYSTGSKDEIVEYLNQAMSGRMSELSNQRERSEKERRRQQRLAEQRNAQAK